MCTFWNSDNMHILQCFEFHEVFFYEVWDRNVRIMKFQLGSNRVVAKKFVVESNVNYQVIYLKCAEKNKKKITISSSNVRNWIVVEYDNRTEKITFEVRLLAVRTWLKVPLVVLTRYICNVFINRLTRSWGTAGSVTQISECFKLGQRILELSYSYWQNTKKT